MLAGAAARGDPLLQLMLQQLLRLLFALVLLLLFLQKYKEQRCQ